MTHDERYVVSTLSQMADRMTQIKPARTVLILKVSCAYRTDRRNDQRVGLHGRSLLSSSSLRQTSLERIRPTRLAEAEQDVDAEDCLTFDVSACACVVSACRSWALERDESSPAYVFRTDVRIDTAVDMIE